MLSDRFNCNHTKTKANTMKHQRLETSVKERKAGGKQKLHHRYRIKALLSIEDNRYPVGWILVCKFLLSGPGKVASELPLQYNQTV
mmetsp:Transcript_27396/g.65771  ORF Transcript_27396/g.65771 Transcript_27396/m.65771 type:complete len:86 (+) Transcript_27396:55-312(+)